jgi:hypothetical protein
MPVSLSSASYIVPGNATAHTGRDRVLADVLRLSLD